MLKKSLAICAVAVLALPLVGCNLATNGLDYSHEAVIQPSGPVVASASDTQMSASDCVGPSAAQMISIDSCVERGDTRVVRGSEVGAKR